MSSFTNNSCRAREGGERCQEWLVPRQRGRCRRCSPPPPAELRWSRRGCRLPPAIAVQFRVSGFGFRVSGFGFRVQGSGFRVQGSGFRVQGSGFRVQSSGCTWRGTKRLWLSAPERYPPRQTSSVDRLNAKVEPPSTEGNRGYPEGDKVVEPSE